MLSAVLASGVLTVTGTSAADTIDVQIGNDDDQVDEPIVVTVNGTQQSFDPATSGPVAHVVVNAGDGNDTVTVEDYPTNSTTNGKVDPDVSISGGAGDDSIAYTNEGANDRPTLDGGDGNDVLYVATEGSQQGTPFYTETGDAGNDTLIAGDADDTAYVGMSGGDGNDTFEVEDFGDAVAIGGGAGTDTLQLSQDTDPGGQPTTIDMNSPVTAAVTPDMAAAGGQYTVEGDVENVTGRFSGSALTVNGNALNNDIDVDMTDEGTATINGGDGNDTIGVEEAAAATLDGGTGNDAFSVAGGDDGPTYVDGGTGTDTAVVDPTGDTTVNVETVTGPAASAAVTGTNISTAGSYRNQGNTAAHALDGNLSTYFDAAAGSGAYVGLDLGSAQTVSQVAYAPRPGYGYRMVGGTVQASNSADFSDAVTVYTVGVTPPDGALTTTTLTSTTPYRYWRYVGPANANCNIAEFQLFAATPPPAVLANGVLTVTGTVAADPITVSLVASDTDASPVTPARIDVTVDGTRQSFAPAQVTSIVVVGANGGQSINVGESPLDPESGSEEYDFSGFFHDTVSIAGGSGNDAINVAFGSLNDPTPTVASVYVDGGAGDDTISYAGESPGTLHGGDGNDTITETVGAAVQVYGDAGNDVLHEGSFVLDQASATLNGGAGDDTFTLGDIDYGTSISGGDGTDTLDLTDSEFGPGSGTTLDLNGGTDGRLQIDGTLENVLDADGTLQGQTVIGNAADNVIDAPQASAVMGMAGNDTITIGQDQLVNGGDGNDTLIGGNAHMANDTVSGGAGTDLLDLSADTAAQTVYLDGSQAGTGGLLLSGNDIEQVTTGSGNDMIYAQDGRPETINGGAGTDTAYVDAAGDTTLNVENVVKPATTHQLTGTTIGTAGSYKSQGNTIAKATDGSLNTYFDAPTASGAYVGIDLGSTQVVTQIKFAPRSGYASRMVGGVFQASSSASFASPVTVYTVTATPAQGALTTVNVSAGSGFRYWRYVGPTNGECNIAEFQLYGSGSTTPTSTQLTGTTVGTSGSYKNQGNTAAKATDGNLSTFFDAPTASGSYVGIDLGSARVVTQIGFAPRAGYESRMVGGVFQASNSADFSNAVTVYTVGTTPKSGTVTTVAVSAGAAYRYWRYVGPANSNCNIAEFQLFGY